MTTADKNKAVGFIGLGNVGAKLAGSLLRNGADLTIRDLGKSVATPLLEAGAKWADSPAAMAASCDILITCLPSPSISAQVLEAEDGLLAGFGAGKIWAEMSTTDETEIHRLAAKISALGGRAVDCPVSGGCHRAATGNISIFAGCARDVFDEMLPYLTMMGRRILHTGQLGSATILKVVTNYLATANLVSVAEALSTCQAAGMDLRTSYQAIAMSSGTSFVHETEGQVILNGSRDINFTMDLVLKDISLFQDVANRSDLQLEIAPLLVEIFKDGIAKYGPREFSPNIIRRLEDAHNLNVQTDGFPDEITDDEPELPGYEVKI
ncbi:MAG: NAD(P)-dependent oxidoreductase [Candidatus Puniceispirillaceae bacterium]